MIVHRTTPNSQNWVITANSPPEVKEASTTCHRRSRKTLTLGTKIQLRVTFHNFPNPRDTRYHVTEVTTIHNHLPYICVNSPGSLWRMSRQWVLKHVQVVVVVKKRTKPDVSRCKLISNVMTLNKDYCKPHCYFLSDIVLICGWCTDFFWSNL